jgi:hypothetical protein
LTNLETWAAHKEKFHPQEGSHYIDLPDGSILVAASFSDEASELRWESHKNVHALPDPSMEGNVPLSASHHAALRHLFDDDKSAKGPSRANFEPKTVLDVAKVVGSIHPQMRIRGIAR